MIFADKLIALRKKAGYSQEELAQQLNVTRQSVSKWEGAQSVPDIEKILQISKLFGVYYLLSACISFTVSVIFNYVCSMKFVFTRREDISRAREFVTFVLLSIIGLLINEAMMWLGVSVLGIFYMVTKIFATAVVMVWNFVSRKIWLEKKER